MKKLKKYILNILLTLIFKKRVYVYPFVQSCVKLQLLILINDKYVLVKDGNRFKIPSIEIDLEKKSSIVQSLKNLVKEKVSKKVNSNVFFDLSLLDFCRNTVQTNQEASLYEDNLYIKIYLDGIVNEEDLLKSAMLCSVEDIKLLQFKNKFHTYDYKVVIKSQKTEGIALK